MKLHPLNWFTRLSFCLRFAHRREMFHLYTSSTAEYYLTLYTYTLKRNLTLWPIIKNKSVFCQALNPDVGLNITYQIFFCSVRSPSLTSMAESSLSVELADLDWLFFIPNNHRTSSLMAWTWGKRPVSFTHPLNWGFNGPHSLKAKHTFANTSGETSSSVVHSLPFLLPTDWKEIK